MSGGSAGSMGDTVGVRQKVRIPTRGGERQSASHVEEKVTLSKLLELELASRAMRVPCCKIAGTAQLHTT